jgi:hypothetical protein
MNKKITLLFTLLAFALSSSAQISFDINEYEDLNLDYDRFDFDKKYVITNNAENADDTTFIWKVSSVDRQDGWDYTVCSGLVCVPNPDREYEYTIPLGSSDTFKLGFTTLNKAGSGNMTVIVWSKKNPIIRDSIKLAIVTRDRVSVDAPSKTKFVAYPNPAKDFITVKLVNGGSETVKVYDILGNLHISKAVSSGDKLDVSKLSKGVYVLRIEGGRSYSQVIHKQ